MHFLVVSKKGKPAFLRPQLSKHVKVYNARNISLKNKLHKETHTSRDVDASKLQTQLCHVVPRKGERTHFKLASILGFNLFPNHIRRRIECIVFPGHQPVMVNSRHPEYTSYVHRLQSFASWSLPRNEQMFANMAKCGLFYTGKGDLVRCYQCNLGLKDWADDDDPLMEHIKYSPNCNHLENTIHPTKLSRYKEIVLPMSSSIDLRLVNPQTRQIHRSPQYQGLHSRISTFTFPPKTGQTPDILAEAGFFFTGTRDLVRCFSCDGGLTNFHPNDDAWIEHARWFPHCLHVRSERGSEYVQLVQDAIEVEDQDQATHATDERVTYCEVSNSSDDSSELEVENRRLKAKLKCKKCGTNDINVLFLPCCHHNFCFECSNDDSICGVCGSEIIDRVKTYMA